MDGLVTGLVTAMAIMSIGLDSPDYRQRDASTIALTKMNQKYDIRLLLSPLLNNTNPEIKMRAQIAYKGYYQVQPPYVLPYPVISAYDGATDAAWVDQYRTVHFMDCDYYREESCEDSWMYGTMDNYVWKKITDDRRPHEEATREFVKTLFKRGLTRYQVINILGKMQTNEANNIEYEPDLDYSKIYGMSFTDIAKGALKRVLIGK